MQALHTHDGLPLHLRQWAAPGLARGTVLVCHGLGEHIGRYGHVAQHLNAAGWHVAGFDQRGHGASGGPRGVLPAPDALLDDLGRVVDAVRSWKSGPLVLLGHSMGGALAARFVAESVRPHPARWYREVAGLVLSSPALALHMNIVQQGLLAVLGTVAPRTTLGNGLKPAWLCRDAAVVQAYTNDPLVHRRVSPALVNFSCRTPAPRCATPRRAGRCPPCCCTPGPTPAWTPVAVTPSPRPRRCPCCATSATTAWRMKSSTSPNASACWPT